jgi:hypothetical protein
MAAGLRLQVRGATLETAAGGRERRRSPSAWGFSAVERARGGEAGGSGHLLLRPAAGDPEEGQRAGEFGSGDLEAQRAHLWGVVTGDLLDEQCGAHRPPRAGHSDLHLRAGSGPAPLAPQACGAAGTYANRRRIRGERGQEALAAPRRAARAQLCSLLRHRRHAPSPLAWPAEHRQTPAGAGRSFQPRSAVAPTPGHRKASWPPQGGIVVALGLGSAN